MEGSGTFVTYSLPFHNPPNTETTSIVSTTKDLGIILNTRLRAEDDVASAVSKTRRIQFNLKRSFVTLTPSIFLPLYKMFIRLIKHPILFRDTEALEKVQKLALKFVKGVQHVRYEAALQHLRLFCPTHR